MVVVYGLTNQYSKDINACMFIISAFDPKHPIADDEKVLTTHSVLYYHSGYHKCNLKSNIYDFKYILQIELHDDKIHIVKSKSDIVKGMFNKNGLINMTHISQSTKKNINGVILYDFPNSKRSEYIPYFLLGDECIKKVQVKYQQRPISRVWYSTEPCHQYSHGQCIDSESCLLEEKSNINTKNKNGYKVSSIRKLLKVAETHYDEMCVVNPAHQKMQMAKLNSVMLPFKLYGFTEFMITPYDTEIEQQPTASFKPRGLWFAQGAEWLQHMKKTNFNMNKYNYLYTLRVDLSRLILITNLHDLQTFSSMFCNQKKSKHDSSICMDIDWQKVIKDTKKDGILISPNLKTLLNKHKPQYVPTTTFSGLEWYITWDVASGVIWNKKAVTYYRPIYHREQGRFGLVM